MVWTGGSQGALAPSLVAFYQQADARWPDRANGSDGTLGDTAHASRTSDHNPKAPNPPGWVDAADITEDFDNGPNLPALWDHLIATRDRRVKYLIYEGRIVKSYVDSSGRPAWVPQPYTGTNAHAHHLHVSVTPEGRDDTSAWFPTTQTEGYPVGFQEDVYENFRQIKEELLPEVHKDVRYTGDMVDSILRGGFNKPSNPGSLSWLDAKLAPILARLDALGDAVDVDEAEVARLVLAGLDGASLSDDQVQAIIDALPPIVVAAVKQAGREGTG